MWKLILTSYPRGIAEYDVRNDPRLPRLPRLMLHSAPTWCMQFCRVFGRKHHLVLRNLLHDPLLYEVGRTCDCSVGGIEVTTLQDFLFVIWVYAMNLILPLELVVPNVNALTAHGSRPRVVLALLPSL